MTKRTGNDYTTRYRRAPLVGVRVALLTCVECGGQVSSRAAACPTCGAPVSTPPSDVTAMPSNPDATVQRLWQLTKQTNSGTVLTVDAVIQGLSTAFAKTDIAATKTDENRLLLARSGSAITNKVAFNGELTVVDSDERIIVKLTGNKNATAAAAGSLLDVCASIAVCPPLLCCTGVNAVDEANYVEKNTEAMLAAIVDRVGATLIR